MAKNEFDEVNAKLDELNAKIKLNQRDFEGLLRELKRRRRLVLTTLRKNKGLGKIPRASPAQRLRKP